jgi:hypothetical protein
MSKTPQELAAEKNARQWAALNLQEPDRVPFGAIFVSIGGDLVPEYGGITQAEFAHDYDKALKAVEKYNHDFQFDVAGASLMGLGGVFGMALANIPELASMASFITAPIHKVLKDKYFKFPGNELADNATPQFIGGSFMEADEYDQLAGNPLNFIVETILPRVMDGLDTPKNAMEIWTSFGVELERYRNASIRLGMSMASQGYGFIPFGITQAPLDVIADFLRGVTNTVLDTRRHPEKLKKACEALVDPLVDYALAFKKCMGAQIIFIPLHMNEYLSPELYQEFYWPTLKEIINRLLENNLKSIVFFEGQHEPHLETILELPRGWGVAYFEKTDIVKAKEVLKDNCCVAGGLPLGLIVNGTPDDIDAYIKELFEKVKSGGGFMLAPSTGVAPVGTPHENLRAIMNAVEKYGYY